MLLQLPIKRSLPVVSKRIDNSVCSKSLNLRIMIFHFISKTTCALLTGCCAPCKLELDALVLKKRQEYFINSKRRASISQSTSNDQYPGPGWKPKGILAAHLHEHQVKCSQLWA